MILSTLMVGCRDGPPPAPDGMALVAATQGSGQGAGIDVAIRLSGVDVPLDRSTTDAGGQEDSGVSPPTVKVTQYPDDASLRLIEWFDIPGGSAGAVRHHFKLVRLMPPKAISLLQGSWCVHFRGGWQDLTTGDETLDHAPGSITIIRERRHRSFEPADGSVASGAATPAADHEAPPGYVAKVDECRMASTYSIADHGCRYESTDLLLRHAEDVRAIMDKYGCRVRATQPVRGDYVQISGPRPAGAGRGILTTPPILGAHQFQVVEGFKCFQEIIAAVHH